MNTPYINNPLVSRGQTHYNTLLANDTIVRGQVVCYYILPTEAGVFTVTAINPNNANLNTDALATAFFAGVALEAAASGDMLQVIPSGVCNYAILIRGTRAATTDSWPSFAAINRGDLLQIDKSANGFKFNAVAAAGTAVPSFTLIGLTSATDTASQTAASATTAASNAYSAFSGATAYTMGVRVLLRDLG